MPRIRFVFPVLSCVIAGLALASLLLAVPKASSAQTYDAASQFTGTNPNGVWSYGWSTTLGSAFTIDTDYQADRFGNGLSGWYSDLASDGNPSVAYNPTGAVVTGGTETWQPGILGIHPGPADQICIVRFTTPLSGVYSIDAAYDPINSLATTDVHVLVNSVSVFDGAIDGTGTSASYGPASLPLNAGDTVDFVCGYGSNGNNGNDRTAVAATIALIAAQPVITSFTPASGPVGTVVTITGMYLNGVSAVRFHDANAKIFSVNSAGTQITVTVPVGPKKGTITVTTPGGVVSTATPFTVTPVITSFSPSSGPVGTTVVIKGTGLNGVTAVRFHDASATVFSSNQNGTALTVTVPRGAAKGTITVTTPGGSVTTASPFTITP